MVLGHLYFGAFRHLGQSERSGLCACACAFSELAGVHFSTRIRVHVFLRCERACAVSGVCMHGPVGVPHGRDASRRLLAS
eukprot:2535121-Pleurochrysis_carterae.AAC.3